MKFQRGDAGIGMLAIMVVMMVGIWVTSGHGRGHSSKPSVANPSIVATPTLPAEGSDKKGQSSVPVDIKSD